MHYQKHYDKLINRARNRLLECYTENHHVIPRCMNGSNEVGNIVALTSEEHYFAHQLLVKIYPNESKLIFAAQAMTFGLHRNNKLYGWLKKKWIGEIKGKTFEERYGDEKAKQLKENLIMKNKGKKLSKEQKQEISKRMKGNIYGKGKSQSEESNRKRSETLKGRISPMKGKKHKEESKQKISEAMTGEKNPFYGKTHTKESKRKISEEQKGKSWSPARRAAYERRWK